MSKPLREIAYVGLRAAVDVEVGERTAADSANASAIQAEKEARERECARAKERLDKADKRDLRMREAMEDETRQRKAAYAAAANAAAEGMGVALRAESKGDAAESKEEIRRLEERLAELRGGKF